MAGFNSLLCSVPDGHGILFVRLVLLILSIAALTVYGTTVATYNNNVESTGAFTPSHHRYPLTANVVTLIPSALSSIWAIIYLSLLARRLLQTHRCQSRGLAANPHTTRQIWRGGRPVIHPGWVLAADAACWTFFVVMAVLSGVEATRWKAGTVDYGSEAMRQQVDLSACPTFDPASRLLDYWCEQAWYEVVDLTNSGTSILGTLAGIYCSRALFACLELYVSHRYHRKHSLDDDTTAYPPHQTQEIELEQK